MIRITPKLSLQLLTVAAAILLFGCLSMTPYSVGFSGLPENFDGFKIAVISDLHNYRLGKKLDTLANQISEQAPDMAILAGDIVNKSEKNIGNVRDFLEAIAGICPVYAVAGNHEMENPYLYAELQKTYEEYGVVFLDGQTVLLERGEQQIAISNQKIVPRRGRGKFTWIAKDTEPIHKDLFNIFIHHFGNEFDSITDEYDLVISGHVHGGIIRVFNRGVIGNKTLQLFPKYTKGVYRKDSGSVMVLSAGLGNTVVPRINNPREVVIITLTVTDGE